MRSVTAPAVIPLKAVLVNPPANPTPFNILDGPTNPVTNLVAPSVSCSAAPVGL